MELTKKNDFIEIEYLGKTEGDVFDTNISEELKKINPEATAKPLIVSIGQQMVIPGFDKDLEGKELGKKYTVKIEAKQAYGPRKPELIRLIPKKIFTEQNMNPVPGMTISLDNNIAKVVSASGGRIMVDFNNPLAGKELEFEYIIKRKLTDLKEKVNALQDFFFRKQFEFEIDEEKKKIVFKEIQLVPILKMFREKFQEMLGYDVEIFVNKAKKEDNQEKEKQENETNNL